MVVGDIHGQYFDLLNILKKWRPDHNLLFLGDYVDRGAFSCEVILHLLALKLKYPHKVFLIRGNHECSTVSAHFGFKEECKVKYGLTVYYRFLLCFQTMPICAIIKTKVRCS
jgi:serine/threonine-protein phosphatase 2B catalytic subunit